MCSQSETKKDGHISSLELDVDGWAEAGRLGQSQTKTGY